MNEVEKDFSYFREKDDHQQINYNFNLVIGEIPWNLLPDLKSSKQSFNSITYDHENLRYNDYYKECLSIYNYKTEQCSIYSSQIDRLHEIAYLCILSRTGKALDAKGIHKVHACGVADEKRNLVVMMPMKGGKTTLFMELLKNKNLKIISDDSPVIDTMGRVLPFPLRIGLEEIDHIKDRISMSEVYTIDRKQFGKKYLIPLNALENKIIPPLKKRSVLIQGVRCSNKECHLEKITSFQMFQYLCTHMVVGVGLPLIIEYFLRPNLKDWILNFKIGIKRTIAAYKLALESEKYICYMGEDPELNAREIYKQVFRLP
jgi:hypothetical protein